MLIQYLLRKVKDGYENIKIFFYLIFNQIIICMYLEGGDGVYRYVENVRWLKCVGKKGK